MTTIQRDLTPFEIDRLDFLRVRFSGMPNVAELVAEEEREFRALPVPGPCPAWCEQPAGHVYDSTATDGTYHLRFHEVEIGDMVSVVQEEKRLADGTTVIGATHVACYIDSTELDADRAAEQGAALLRAATKLREISGGAA